MRSREINKLLKMRANIIKQHFVNGKVESGLNYRSDRRLQKDFSRMQNIDHQLKQLKK
jgi:hypothetical protein